MINFFDKLFDSINGGTLRPRCGKPVSGGVLGIGANWVRFHD
jgi:hypothetical protein